jgi:hypothetical protein
MVAYAEQKPLLLIKKLGAMIFLVLGILLTATGMYGEAPSLTTLGILLLVAGAILLVLKIARRNQDAG